MTIAFPSRHTQSPAPTDGCFLPQISSEWGGFGKRPDPLNF